MRINVHGVNMEVSSELQRYAESHLWLAMNRAARRVGWAGASLEREDRDGHRVTCRADAWLRGLGLVSARGSAWDAFEAVDLAVLRLEQAIAGRIAAAASGDAAPRDFPGTRVRKDKGSPWHAAERAPGDRTPRFDAADRDRRDRDPARTESCPFLDYDPIGIPIS